MIARLPRRASASPDEVAPRQASEAESVAATARDARAALEQFHRSPAYKVARVAAEFSRAPGRTSLTALLWLAGTYRRQGTGLIGALHAEDPIGKVVERLRTSLRDFRFAHTPVPRTDEDLDDGSAAPGRPGRVSLILPFADSPDLLDDTIRDALAQTHRDLELIVVSTLPAATAAPALAAHLANPRVIALETPCGPLCSALEQGLRCATGEFVGWLTVGERLADQHVARRVEFLRAHADAAAVFSGPADHGQEAGALYRRATAWALGGFAPDLPGAELLDLRLRAEALFECGQLPDSPEAAAPPLSAFDSSARRAAQHRDLARRDALERDFSFVQFGTTWPLPFRGSADAVCYAWSQRALAPDRGDAGGIRICWMDVRPRAVAVDQLAATDLVLVPTREGFDTLAPELGSKVLRLDGQHAPDLLARIAKARAVERTLAGSPARPVRATPVVVQPLRVALQVETMDRGGLEQVVAALARRFDRQRFEVTVLVAGDRVGERGEALAAEGIPVIPLGHDLSRLERVIATRHFDLVNLHYSLFGVPLYERLGVPTIYTLHNSYTWLASRQLRERIDAFRRIPRFIAVSAQVADYASNRLGVPAARVTVVPNGLAADHFDRIEPVARASLGIPDDAFVFVNAASVVALKNQNLALSAFAELARELPAAHLVFAGEVIDRELKQVLDRRVRDRGLDGRVHFTGFLPSPRLAGLLQVSDAFVLPSFQEGWSIALMEALHFGLPIIATDTGSARELLADGAAGVLIPNAYRHLEDLTSDDLGLLSRDPRPANTQALVNAMRDLAAHRAQWRASARERRECLGERYSLSRQVERYQHEYASTVAIYAKTTRGNGPEASG